MSQVGVFWRSSFLWSLIKWDQGREERVPVHMQRSFQKNAVLNWGQFKFVGAFILCFVNYVALYYVSNCVHDKLIDKLLRKHSYKRRFLSCISHAQEAYRAWLVFMLLQLHFKYVKHVNQYVMLLKQCSRCSRILPTFWSRHFITMTFKARF